MNQINEFFKRHSLFGGLVLMFAITWAIEFAHTGFMGLSIPYGVYIFLGWGFVLGAVFTTLQAQGDAGVKDLLRRYLIWRIGWKWVVFALFLYPSIYMAAILLTQWIYGIAIDFTRVYALRLFDKPEQLWLFVVPFFLVDLIANGEEIGWRGFVLPRLQLRYSPFTASIILGVIWGLWHLPKHLVAWDTQVYGLYMIRIVGDAVLYTELFNNTRGSLLVTSIFHAMQNTAGAFLPISGVTSIFIIVLTWGVVTVTLFVERRRGAEPVLLTYKRPEGSDVGL